MGKTLILLTSSYPVGPGESFLANEIPFLAAAFDEIVIMTNTGQRGEVAPLPASVSWVSHPYLPSTVEKATSLLGLLSPTVWAELQGARRFGLRSYRTVIATALISWFKANQIARRIRSIAARKGTVHVYSYWGDDMAVAAALARRNGWVERAWSRAHGWDVYMDRTGYLPFRRLLAVHLDHLLFVSEHGRRYFESLLGASYPSVKCSRLGTPAVATEPLSRLRPFTIVSCSRLIPLKRVERIAEALYHVRAPIRWIHVGDGPNRDSVNEVCAGLPAHVAVELRGALPHADVTRTYARERPTVFLSVSRSEGLPVSMMEAMSAGIPVISTDVGGVPEIVSDGVNGALLSADATPIEIAGAVDRFASLTEEAHARYARAAWETWSTEFRAERNYGKFLETVQG